MKQKEYLQNPFKTTGIELKDYMTSDNETITVDPKTGELYTMKKVSRNKQILHDSKIYIKLFQDKSDVLINLPYQSMRVFFYICSRVRPMRDYVYLSKDDIVAVLGDISEPTLRAAIGGLIEANIIARKMGSNIEYWINPDIIFNGSRLKLIQGHKMI
jgi:hypothetical protein